MLSHASVAHATADDGLGLVLSQGVADPLDSVAKCEYNQVTPFGHFGGNDWADNTNLGKESCTSIVKVAWWVDKNQQAIIALQFTYNSGSVGPLHGSTVLATSNAVLEIDPLSPITKVTIRWDVSFGVTFLKFIDSNGIDQDIGFQYSGSEEASIVFNTTNQVLSYAKGRAGSLIDAFVFATGTQY